ncbi:wax ester/triacylglycerol synthase family O-acyltransferase [Microbacterium sp. zg-Y818]|uniref:wax ester/triacylglycerol synthase domain-containing protein n=1 Tax=unclassified Microbacterium TaxID=2609290 RepID=UPI00214C6C57|nr:MULTISPECIES: wax ester/triacylglycerol synthase domain-containing protein [unclassified Microbacterium]MCR2800592.1 WS/DGAT domain-containing protein [Microbacterium sp. zg.Y818]WIM23320.1 wax ester/triacylglycerol synthase family O-acyltransferase [Microbacterium sp. zg-Y818]
MNASSRGVGTAGPASPASTRVPPQRLAPSDRANLIIDRPDQVNVFLVAGLLTPGGFVAPDGSVDMHALRQAVTVRARSIRELRRVVAPRFLRAPAWSEKTPDPQLHIRLLDPIADTADLERVCARLMVTPLARDRPLWEMLILPCRDGVRVGFILRIHHVLADGMTAVDIVRRLLAPADDSPAQSPADGAGAPLPGAAPTGPRSRTAAFRRFAATLGAHRMPDTVLLGPLGRRRAVAFADADLSALRSHAAARGATVNDALLSVIAAGYHAALVASGEPVPAELAVSVPVALDRHGQASNQVGLMVVPLPLTITDPDKRLTAVATITAREKPAARRQGTLEMMRGPLGARIMVQLAKRQHLVAGFVTNVRGPSGALRLAGAPVTALWPVAVIAGNVRLGVAAVSYAGRLWCGIHFDAEHVAGDVFADAMREALARTGA